MFYISMRNADGTQYYSGMSWTHDYDEATIFANDTAAQEECELIKRECADSYEQGDYGIYKLSIWAYEPRLKIITTSQTEDEDDGYGGGYTRYIIAEVPKGLTDEQIAELVREEFPGTRCEHEHDCCGHYYASTATWMRGQLGWNPEGSSTVLIEQGWSQNV